MVPESSISPGKDEGSAWKLGYDTASITHIPRSNVGARTTAGRCLCRKVTWVSVSLICNMRRWR
jgi:hypothetical protein